MLSVTVAAKFVDESYFTNKWYAEIGGVNIQEYNALEVEFMVNLIQFELFVGEDDYERYLQMVQKYYVERSKSPEIKKSH